MATNGSGAWSWAAFFRGVARRLGVRGGRPRSQQSAADLDSWRASPEATIDTMARLLDEIERDALAVYSDRGLPTRSGHYARPPDGVDWQFVAEQMPAEERWRLVFDYPPDQGWRFATLEDLGQHAPADGPLRRAAELLAGCRMLRGPNDAGTEGSRDRLAAAVKLGVDWRSLQSEQRATNDPLIFAKPKRLPRRKTPD